MPPFNLAAMIAASLAGLVGAAYAVHEALKVLQFYVVLLGVSLAIAAIFFGSVHHLDNLSRQQPRYVLRDRYGHPLRETNWRFVGWCSWFYRRSDGVTAHDRDGDEYVADSWVQGGDMPPDEPIPRGDSGPVKTVVSLAFFRAKRNR
jgi:hypothetical protein